MVRRAAASKLGEFAKVVEEDKLKNELFPIFEDLAKDDQDSVRVLAVEAGIVLVTLLRDDPTKLGQIKPIMKELAVDRSWRSRYMVAERIVEVCSLSLIVYDSFFFRFKMPSRTRLHSKKPSKFTPIC